VCFKSSFICRSFYFFYSLQIIDDIGLFILCNFTLSDLYWLHLFCNLEHVPLSHILCRLTAGSTGFCSFPYFSLCLPSFPLSLEDYIMGGGVFLHGKATILITLLFVMSVAQWAIIGSIIMGAAKCGIWLYFSFFIYLPGPLFLSWTTSIKRTLPRCAFCT
jgi:hypothetical protein